MESPKKERANLLGINYLSKHMSTPLSMGGSKSGMYMDSMAPKMESPMEKELVGGQKNLPEGLQKAIEAAPDSPAGMHGSPMHKQGEKDKDDESIAGRIGKKGSDISSKDRRNESLGDRGTRTK